MQNRVPLAKGAIDFATYCSRRSQLSAGETVKLAAKSARDHAIEFFLCAA